MPNEFVGVLDRYIIHLKRENDNIEYKFYTNSSNTSINRQEEASSILSNYFQLSIKLTDLISQWSKSDQRFANNRIPLGIRVLAQDPLENLLSFICSSNNNVQRITKMIKSLSSSILSNYFQLSIKLTDLISQWSKSDQRFANNGIPLGIRVLAQDPLENLLSFICSSNNNVQRITKMIKSLCEQYGKEIGCFNGIIYHQFPTIGSIMKN